jgi:hypothetical protein
MNDFTTFQWDMPMGYSPDISEKEISAILDVDFTGSLDIRYGMIFLRKEMGQFDERHCEGGSRVERKDCL